jgi:hypothetical protein
MSNTVIITSSSDPSQTVILEEPNCGSVLTDICSGNTVIFEEPTCTGVYSINGLTGHVTLTKNNISDLSAVDNTSDLNKPISNSTLSALNLKVDKTEFDIAINALDDFYVNTNKQVKRGNEAYLYYSPYSSNFVSAYTNLLLNSAIYAKGLNFDVIQVISGNWTQAYTNLLVNSALYLEGYKVFEFTNTNFLKLSGGTITGNLQINNNLIQGTNNLYIGDKNNIDGEFNVVNGVDNIVFGKNNIVGTKIFYSEYEKFTKSFRFNDSIIDLFGSNLIIGKRFIGYDISTNKNFEFYLAAYDISSNLIFAEDDPLGDFSVNGFILDNIQDSKVFGSNTIVSHENVIALNATSTTTPKQESTKSEQIVLNAENGIYIISNVGIGTDNTEEYPLNVNGEIHSNEKISDNNGNSNEWNSNYSTYKTYSANYVSLQYADSKFFPSTGGLISGDLTVQNTFTVYGNISALGTSYFQNTLYTTTTSLCIIHEAFAGPAVYIASRGTGDLLSLYDLDTGVEVLHVGGHNGDYPNVGVKTSTPNVELTVNGSISASSIIYDVSGNSLNWNYAYEWVDAGIIDGGYF